MLLLKRIVFFICFFIVSFNASAGLSVDYNGIMTGMVTDAGTGAPLANANIRLHEVRRWATTDRDGNYQMSDLPNGKFTAEVSHVGYRSATATVVISAGTIVRNFKLSQTVVESDEVTVTGVSSITQLRNVPAHISVIGKTELLRSAGANILDAVSKQPGVNVVSTGPAIAKPFIRGLGYNRVVTLNDGVRQEGQQWGDEHGLEIDQYSAQKVEVLRGPASLMYGSDALGGVIHILTNTPVPNNIIRANLSANFHTNNKLWGPHANFSGNLNGWNWNIYGSLKNAADYSNRYDGQVLNSRFNEKNFGGYLGLNKNWGYSHLIFSTFDQNLGMVEGERDNTGAFVLEGYDLTGSTLHGRTPLVPYQNVKHHKLALDNAFSFDNGGRLATLLAYQVNKRSEFGDPEQPDDADMLLNLNSANYSLAYHFPSGEKWKASVGLNGMSQQNNNKGEEMIIPDYEIFDMGFYGYGSLLLGKLTLSGGARFDFRNLSSEMMSEADEVKFTAIRKQFSNISASLGVTRELSRSVLLKANLSKGFRAPNISELAANGEHEGTKRYEVGNSFLKSESSLSLDGGVQVTTEHVDLSLSLFHNQMFNYIYQQKLLAFTGEDSLVHDSPAFRFEQQDAKLAGVEAGIDIHPHPLDWLHFENTFSFVRGKFLQAVDGSKNLPLIAPARLLTELRAEFADPSGYLKNVYLKLESDMVWAQRQFFAGYNTETATDGYLLLNAGLGTDVVITDKPLATIMISVNNLTDRAYQSHLSRLKYLDENPLTGRRGVYNMGRNFTVKLIIPMEWKLKRTL